MNQTTKKVVTDIKKGIAALTINFIAFALKSTEYFCEYFLYFNVKYRVDMKQAINKLIIRAIR